MSPLEKVAFGSFPYKMPFDYQMVTFEEIIKNDFFKWTQLFKLVCKVIMFVCVVIPNLCQ